jgi:hypothetical protein
MPQVATPRQSRSRRTFSYRNGKAVEITGISLNPTRWPMIRVSDKNWNKRGSLKGI